MTDTAKQPGRAQPSPAVPQPKATAPGRAVSSIDERLAEVKVPVSIVIGRKEIALGDIGAWRGDTLVSLDQSTDDPLEVHVNGTCVATAELCEGEADGSLAVRILDVVKG